MRLIARTYLFAVVAAVIALSGVFVAVVVLQAFMQERFLAVFRLTVAELVQKPEESARRAALRRAADLLRAPLILYDADGKFVDASSNANSGVELDVAELRKTGLQTGDGFVAVAIVVDDAIVGYCVLVLTGPPMALATPATLAGGGVVLLGLFFSALVFARGIARPLKTLENAALEFGAGNFSRRVALERSDELGNVGRAFDAMADRIVSLMQAQQELIANVSHELRTPLARLRVLLDTARELRLMPDSETLIDIEREAAELERLVEDVMQTARLDRLTSGAPPLRLQKIMLDEVIADAVERFRGNHTTHALVCDVTEPTALLGDPMLLRRVIDNVLDNSRRYADAGSPVRVSLARDQDTAVIAIADEGIGIASDEIGGIFTPFFRTDRSRSRNTGGVGLGLSLARRIIEAHGGTITLESRVGVGTTVRMRLPIDGVELA